MKLDHDCVRDLLLTIEEKSTLTDVLTDGDLFSSERLEKYDEDELYYTLLKVNEAGFLNANVMILPDYKSAVVQSLTYEGHSFLDNIRDNKVWEKTKEKIGSSATSVSISIIGQVAGSVIKGMMGLT